MKELKPNPVEGPALSDEVYALALAEVRDGGQAIVAGRMKAGGSGKRTGGGRGK